VEESARGAKLINSVSPGIIYLYTLRCRINFDFKQSRDPNRFQIDPHRTSSPSPFLSLFLFLFSLFSFSFFSFCLFFSFSREPRVSGWWRAIMAIIALSSWKSRFRKLCRRKYHFTSGGRKAAGGGRRGGGGGGGGGGGNGGRGQGGKRTGQEMDLITMTSGWSGYPHAYDAWRARTHAPHTHTRTHHTHTHTHTRARARARNESTPVVREEQNRI